MLTVPGVFYGSAAICGAMLLLALVEGRVGRRLLLSRFRTESDVRIINAAEGLHRGFLRLVDWFIAFGAQFARALLAQSIVRGRRMSARLRDVAERRRVAPGNGGSVSSFLQAIAEHKHSVPPGATTEQGSERLPV